MTNDMRFDTGPLSWVKPTIDQTLQRASAALHTPDPTQIEQSRAELHAASGALRMAGVPGAARFCEALESAYGFMLLQPGAMGLVDAVHKAIDALAGHLAEMLASAEDVTLRLLPVYRKLMAAQDLRQVSGSDLFFPASCPECSSLSPVSLTPTAAARVRAWHDRYQQGLLGWLRNQASGIEAMQDALRGIRTLVGSERSFWWLAAGLTEAVAAGRSKPSGKLRRLFARIDAEIVRLAKGEPGAAAELLVRQILYYIGREKPLAGIAGEIHAALALQRYFPGHEADLDHRRRDRQNGLTPAQDRVAPLLQQAQEQWAAYYSGENTGHRGFLQALTKLQQQGSTVQNAELERLIDALAGIFKNEAGAASIPDNEQALAVAAVLITAEELVELPTLPSVELRNRTLSAISALHRAWGRQAVSDPLPEDQSDNRTGQQAVTLQVAPQLRKSLQQLEQILDESFRNPEQGIPVETALAELQPLEAAFRMLQLDAAAALTAIIRQQLPRLEQARGQEPTVLQQRVAETLCGLDLFVESLSAGRNDFARILPPLLAQWPPEPRPTPAAGTRENELAQGQTDHDPDIVTIFQEEAQDVLHAIKDALGHWDTSSDRTALLQEIRRGFHTLKGSSRVAGLSGFGEHAWDVERTLNKCLEDPVRVPTEVVGLIHHAHGFFSRWCATGLDAIPDGSDLATRVEAALGALTAAPASTDPDENFAATATLAIAPPRPVPAIPEPVDADVVFDNGLVISAALFEIFIAEATQHLGTLRDEMGALRFGRPVRHEFMRVAHTLAGIARTIGVQTLADLSHALEKWLQHLLIHAIVPGTEQLQVMETAISGLAGMVDQILQQHAPTPETALIQQLNALLAASLAPAQGSPTAKLVPVDQGQSASVRPLPQRAPGALLIDEDLDSGLLAIFLEEAGDLAATIGADLRAWRSAPAARNFGENISRTLHTLKGSARAVGAMRLGERVHALENEVEQELQSTGIGPRALDSFEREFDRWCETFEALQLQLRQKNGSDNPDTVASATPDSTLANAAQRALPTLRVRADLIDHMVENAGEISLSRSRIEGSTRSSRRALSDSSDRIGQLRSQLREIEIAAEAQLQSRSQQFGANEIFDPLEFDRYTRMQEISRIMAESMHDLSSLQLNLRRHIDEVDAALQQQLRANQDLQQILLRIQTIPFTSVAERLHRVVRQTSTELGRHAQLAVQGGHVELDRELLETLMAPLEHMLRNAVAHGIETPADRDRAGKAETGQITVRLRQEGNQILIDVSDDGAGLDFKCIRAKGERLGLLPSDAITGEQELAELIFRPGFSTADNVTEIAGRGIGMDVVHSVISRLGGKIDVQSTRGCATHFTLSVPLTLAVTQALFVKAGNSTVAIPSNLIAQVQRYRPGQIEMLYEQTQVEWQGRSYPFHYLPKLLGHGSSRGNSRTHSMVILLASGEDRLALQVDELQQNQEIAIKDIGPQLAGIPGLAGATISSSGEIVFILNPLELARRPATAATIALPDQVDIDLSTATVMVVDDSLTVRKVTSRLLSRAGYVVLTAKDGVDALEQLQEQLPAAILLDIEMPRMDGFELTRFLRSDPRTRHIPLIMISSRTAEKHQLHAAQLGVNKFLGKPFQDEELLGLMARLTNLDRTVACAG